MIQSSPVIDVARINICKCLAVQEREYHFELSQNRFDSSCGKPQVELILKTTEVSISIAPEMFSTEPFECGTHQPVEYIQYRSTA